MEKIHKELCYHIFNFEHSSPSGDSFHINKWITTVECDIKDELTECKKVYYFKNKPIIIYKSRINIGFTYRVSHYSPFCEHYIKTGHIPGMLYESIEEASKFKEKLV